MAIPFAVVAGVGPGTGAAVARRFAKAYPVALLARKSESYSSLVDEINNSGGKAIGISTDVSDASSVKSAFGQIEQKFGGQCAAAIFNASGPFKRASVLDLTEDDFVGSYNVSCKGAFLFTQSALPLLLAHYKSISSSLPNDPPAASSSTADSPPLPPTLIFTGATASVKSNALMSAFSTAKYAMRAFAQSVAREFAPKGVHVAHAVIDGVIDIPRTKEWLKDMPPEAKVSADGIADTYWGLHAQGRRNWTFEVDVRPMLEKW